jgi:hypothetical protein
MDTTMSITTARSKVSRYGLRAIIRNLVYGMTDDGSDLY